MHQERVYDLVEGNFRIEVIQKLALIRPRRSDPSVRPYAPYALSFVNDDNQTNHFQVYWNEQSGYTLDESKEDEPLSSLRYIL